MAENDNTHFGYQRVSTEEKAGRVNAVFESVASRYDLMNDLMSLGLHRIWKRMALELSGVRAGHKVMDLAGGTGDLTQHLAELVGDNGGVWLVDINEAMLSEGRDRLLDAGIGGDRVQYCQADAEHLPFPDNSFDCVTMGFGLRNVTDQAGALAAIERVLKPGGRLLILEFSQPTSALLSRLYDGYSFTVLPALGRWVAGDEASYRYLAESIRMHPNQDTLKGMLERAGFEQCRYTNMAGGIVALHRGFKV